MPANIEKEEVISLQNYIATLVELKVTLGTINELMDNLVKSEEKTAEAMIQLATEMKLIKDKIANIELKILLTNAYELRKNAPNGTQNGEKGKRPADPLKEINKKIFYELIGMFIVRNWKFFVLVAILATIGFFALGPSAEQVKAVKDIVLP